MSSNNITHSTTGSSLGDILEKVLDKGVVIAGDISIALADVELLTIKIRLVVASVERAMEMGIDWWKTDPALCSNARKKEELGTTEIIKRLEKIENRLR
ncbi:MAG: gas vesicle protein [Bacillota bacterium]